MRVYRRGGPASRLRRPGVAASPDARIQSPTKGSGIGNPLRAVIESEPCALYLATVE
jgi:hypothetical protein